MLQTCDDLSVMRFLNERLRFPIGHITDAMVPRAAALFRGGVLLGLLPHGTAPRAAGCSMLLWDDADVAPCMSGASACREMAPAFDRGTRASA